MRPETFKTPLSSSSVSIWRFEPLIISVPQSQRAVISSELKAGTSLTPVISSFSLFWSDKVCCFFETVSFIIKSLCIGYDRTEGFITLLFCIFEIVYKLFNLALKALQNLNVFAKLAICLVKLCFKV